VSSSGVQQVVSGGFVRTTTVSNGGTQSIVAGATASITTVSSGGIQYDAGTASDTTLSGGTQTVVAGGSAVNTIVSSGGIQYDAGIADFTTLSGGTQVVFGSASDVGVSSGCIQQVVAGGTAENTGVASGGTQYDAGLADVTYLDGGTQVVFGSAANTDIFDDGIQQVVAGGMTLCRRHSELHETVGRHPKHRGGW
jgi:autotransporter passenger strand-loop-strand repeat protein